MLRIEKEKLKTRKEATNLLSAFETVRYAPYLIKEALLISRLNIPRILPFSLFC
jgi:hypothetical protein